LTWPCVDAWIRSSPTACAAAMAASIWSFVKGWMNFVSAAWLAQTPA
jgi:hypothetical protein